MRQTGETKVIQALLLGETRTERSFVCMFFFSIIIILVAMGFITLLSLSTRPLLFQISIKSVIAHEVRARRSEDSASLMFMSFPSGF